MIFIAIAIAVTEKLKWLNNLILRMVSTINCHLVIIFMVVLAISGDPDARKMTLVTAALHRPMASGGHWPGHTGAAAFLHCETLYNTHCTGSYIFTKLHYSSELGLVGKGLIHMWLVIRQRMTKCVFCVLCLFVFFFKLEKSKKEYCMIFAMRLSLGSA